ncbi:hypothetical protein H6P81_021329 [Aristolochia fimbriata]|uniref:Uncharacterized protein n=1 Tax=Aristolochia fimbriata TaxID=158543 RepID=A0AAV7DR64_ARIFI|nr:hypothetical protein H6P81_021329 [Aristolochia fimbriata]
MSRRRWRVGLVAPTRPLWQWLAPQRGESSAKAICPSPHGRWPSALLAAGKGPRGPLADPFAQLEVFLIFHAFWGPLGAPSPDLDLPQAGAYGAFVGSPCTGRASGGRTTGAAAKWCTLDMR